MTRFWKNGFPAAALVLATALTTTADGPAIFKSTGNPCVSPSEPDSAGRQIAPVLRQLAEQLRNPQSSFPIRLDVDRDDRTYAFGETMTVTIESAVEGHAYLLYLQKDESVVCLFPNSHRKDGKILAGQPLVVPATTDPFEIEICN